MSDSPEFMRLHGHRVVFSDQERQASSQEGEVLALFVGGDARRIRMVGVCCGALFDLTETNGRAVCLECGNVIHELTSANKILDLLADEDQAEEGRD